MEAGDCLLGVTMQPGGSSKVIAERISLQRLTPPLARSRRSGAGERRHDR